MDDPFTPGFDVDFDFGTGHGLVNATAAIDSLGVAPNPAAPTPVVVPIPVVAHCCADSCCCPNTR
jgi:hypothetical protein